MAAKTANIDKLLRTPDFGSYNNIMDTHITNKATVQGFYIDNLGMMGVNTLNSVFGKYNKKARTNTPTFSAIKIHKFFALHRHVQGKFLRGQAVTSASIISILSNIEQDYMADSAGIGAEDKDSKSVVTLVIFNSPDNFIPLLAYWEVVLAAMNYV